MNPSERVLSPFVVVFCNLPTRDEQGKLVCSYSNKDLTGLIRDFAGNLKNTVKVVYTKNGVVTYRGAAYAYAVFREYYDAYAVCDALESREMGRRHYDQYMSERWRSFPAEHDKVFGWLATKEDFRRLVSHGVKDFKTFKETTIGAIMEEKQNRKARMDEQSESLRKDIERLDFLLDEQRNAVEKAAQDLAGAQADDLAARSCIEAERREKEEELERERLKWDEAIREANRQIEEMQRSRGHQNYEWQQITKQVIRLKALQDQHRRAKAEKEKFDLQCRLEDTEFKTLAEMARKEQEQRAAAKKKFAEMLEKKAAFDNQIRKRKTVEALRAEGVYMSESECPVCMYTFTEIMSHEKQREAGISMEQFRELNKKESDDTHCWRNIVIPCMHAKVCGGCLYQRELHAKEKKKKHTCVQCRADVERYMPARITS